LDRDERTIGASQQKLASTAGITLSARWQLASSEDRLLRALSR